MLVGLLAKDANRLPRGRTYMRNGSVVDLQIEPGCIKAHVSGSEIYQVKVEIDEVQAAAWKWAFAGAKSENAAWARRAFARSRGKGYDA